MSARTQAPLDAAREALAAGDWAEARRRFEAVLEVEEVPEALVGLGEAMVWLGDTLEAARLHERAYSAFRRRPDPVQAAMAGIGLFFMHEVSLGNRAAAGGWLGRVARLVEEHELEPLEGWVLLMRGQASADASAAERLARDALERARRHGDRDLELCALSCAGAAIVRAGRLGEGLALLDEALAGSLAGEAEDLGTVVMASCQMITCCSEAAEFARALEWIRVADDFNRRYGSPHVHAVCRLHHGNVLLATGRWQDADRELAAAIERSRGAEPALHVAALAKLAELRVEQGRFSEAQRLLAGLEDHVVATFSVAAVRRALGEPAPAAALLRRRLRPASGNNLERAALLELLQVIELDLGSPDAALATARRLMALATESDATSVGARAERALGRALAAGGAAAQAVTHLETAHELFAGLGMPLDIARSRLLLAQALARTDPAVAIAEARAARATFEELGAAHDADAAAAWLRTLGVRAGRGGPGRAGELSTRELEVLALIAEGLSNREIAQRIFLAPKTVEHHVRSVLAKLGVRTRAEAAAYAVRHLERDRAGQ